LGKFRQKVTVLQGPTSTNTQHTHPPKKRMGERPQRAGSKHNLFWFSEIRSCLVAHTDLKLKILLPCLPSAVVTDTPGFQSYVKWAIFISLFIVGQL
jgi:hypothetical protein